MKREKEDRSSDFIFTLLFKSICAAPKIMVARAATPFRFDYCHFKCCFFFCRHHGSFWHFVKARKCYSNKRQLPGVKLPPTVKTDLDPRLPQQNCCPPSLCLSSAIPCGPHNAAFRPGEPYLLNSRHTPLATAQTHRNCNAN